jgi:hypothetical protein
VTSARQPLLCEAPASSIVTASHDDSVACLSMAVECVWKARRWQIKSGNRPLAL